MPGVYRPQHPECTILYWMLFHYFERRLDCGNPRCWFARIDFLDCAEERLLMFSCRTRGFCSSFHAKRLKQWVEWMKEGRGQDDELGGRVPNSLEFGACPLIRPHGLPSMQRHDEGHPFPCRLFRNRPDHSSPETDVCRRQTADPVRSASS